MEDMEDQLIMSSQGDFGKVTLGVLRCAWEAKEAKLKVGPWKLCIGSRLN